MQHDPGPWRQGKVGDAIISEAPATTTPAQEIGSEYYGGVLICESVAARNRALIMAAPDLLVALKFVLESQEKQSAINWSIIVKAIEKAEGKE